MQGEELAQEMRAEEAERELDEALAVLSELVDALPKCDICGAPAMVRTLDHHQWCQECEDLSFGTLDVDHAKPLRAAQALLARRGGGR